VKPAAFRYERPETVDEAVSLLAEQGDEAKVLAGGQSLVPAMNMRIARPTMLVDVNRLPLTGVSDDGDSWRVGALVRQSDPRLLRHPLLAEALPHLGHLATRNRGTVAGSLVHADPAAELPLCLTLLGGSVLTSAGREIPAESLFVGHFATTLEPTELVVETIWPKPAAGTGYAFEELSLRRGDFALAMAAAAVSDDGVRVALGAVAERPTIVDADPGRPGESAAAGVEPFGSIHASGRYLKHLVAVLVDRAVARAREAAT
jgi:carbon-monoxide dehydrogenase medium subunit